MAQLARPGQRAAVAEYRRAMEALDLRGGASAAMGIVVRANQHVDRTQPFSLAKDPAKEGELQRVLSELAESLLVASLLLYPLMPGKMAILHRQFAGKDIDPARAVLDAGQAENPSTLVIGKADALFPRIEEPKTP